MADWERQDRWRTALYKARLVLAAGYRLVSEDDETVERVARAMNRTGELGGVPRWNALDDDYRDDYRTLARAALQALRGDQHG